MSPDNSSRLSVSQKAQVVRVPLFGSAWQNRIKWVYRNTNSP